MPPLKAVFFDFDGVIGCTMEDNCRAWAHAFATVHIPFDQREFYLAEGRKASEYVEQVLRRHGIPLEATDILIDLKNMHYKSHSQFSFYDPAEQLVAELRMQGYKVGVVSGGSKFRIMSGSSLPLLSTLDVVITGDDVAVGKPAPEAYLTAARKLCVEPGYCLVVENAPLGIQAAKRAGMTCVAVCSTLEAKDLFEADYVVPTLGDLWGLIFSEAPPALRA